MKSFCIKTNNEKIISYLLNRFEDICLDSIYLSKRDFKIYTNIIIHYSGEDLSSFYNSLSDILTDCILEFYEKDKFKEIINMNYFYFSEIEKGNIYDNCISLIKESTTERDVSKEHIYVSSLKYICENKSMILDGFVNFRLSEYIKVLDYIVDISINEFLIEKEYYEFINLLKVYINSKEINKQTIDLIYMNSESILIDENKNIISVTDNIMNAKYLSDISFSSNDYALNTLLNILPEKIIIHIIGAEDEFVNTLKLIFDKRVSICKNCSICKTYKMINQKV